MSFLSLWAAAGLAAIAIPALVLLYFLKLRRKEELAPSTLLWRRAVQDLQVNAPFQRLRRNLLLLLQLLVLLLLLFALARPMIETTAVQAERIVMLIDTSASMSVIEENGETRLDRAIEQAQRRLRTINRRAAWFSLAPQSPIEVMVIRFARSASVVAPFTTNTSTLANDLSQIRATDERADLARALQLAAAYVTPTSNEDEASAGAPTARILLFSDGGVGDLTEMNLANATLEQVRIGEATDNVGIVALTATRQYEAPATLDIFAQVENFGTETVTSDVSLYVDDVLRAVRTVELAPPADPNQPTDASRRSAARLAWETRVADAGVIRVEIARRDALASDNRALAVVSPPRRLSVLLVTEPTRSTFIDHVLAGLPLEAVTKLSPTQYEALPTGRLVEGGRVRYDVVIMNGYASDRLPRGAYLFIGAAPTIENVSLSGSAERFFIVWWDANHPVLRHVALERVFVARAGQLQTPDDAEILAEGPAGPVLTRYSRDGRQFLMLSFAVEQSTWVTKPSFPVFFDNALRFLGGMSDESQAAQRPGDTLRVAVGSSVSAARLTRPDGVKVDLPLQSDGTLYYADVDRAGLYRIAGDGFDPVRFAVNVADETESNVRPREPELVGSQRVVQGASIDTATPEVWRWFAGAAVALLLLEWWIYNRRVMV